MKMHQNSKGQMTFTTKPPNDFWNEAILIAYLLEKHLWAIWDTCQVSPGHLRHVWRWLPGMGTRNVEGLPHENRKVRTGVCPASGPPSRVRTISQLSRCLYLPTHVKKQPVTQSLHRRIMNISRLSPRSRSICRESVMCFSNCDNFHHRWVYHIKARYRTLQRPYRIFFWRGLNFRAVRFISLIYTLHPQHTHDGICLWWPLIASQFAH